MCVTGAKSTYHSALSTLDTPSIFEEVKEGKNGHRRSERGNELVVDCPFYVKYHCLYEAFCSPLSRINLP